MIVAKHRLCITIQIHLENKVLQTVLKWGKIRDLQIIRFLTIGPGCPE